MYYLEKCEVEDCTRTGYLALEESDIVCNIHKNKQAKVKVTLERKAKEEEEE